MYALNVRCTILSNVRHPLPNVRLGQKIIFSSLTNPNTLLSLIKAFLFPINGQGITVSNRYLFIIRFIIIKHMVLIFRYGWWEHIWDWFYGQRDLLLFLVLYLMVLLVTSAPCMDEVTTTTSLVVWITQGLNPVEPLMTTIHENIWCTCIVIQVRQDNANPIENELRARIDHT
jgi:hypothetical protein